MALLLGIDLGTSYFKVGLFDEHGGLKGLGRVAVGAHSPEPGRVELSVDDFWQRLRAGLNEALREAGTTAAQITAVSYSSQANTFVLLDAEKNALTPLIFWNDQRARPLEPQLERFGQSPERAGVTGLVGEVPERAPVKWRWLARRHPEIWSRTRHALMISDYFTFCLTGKLAGDSSTAVLTGLLDLQRNEWWELALAEFGLRRDLLAEPLRPGSPCGITSSGATSTLGIPAGIPFAVGALDHHAAAMGSGLGAFADASLSTGTVLAALVLVDRVTPASGCIHGAHTTKGVFYRLTFDAAGAGQLEEYQRKHAPHLDLTQLSKLAENPAGPDAVHGRAMKGLLDTIAESQRRLLQAAASGARVRAVTATGGGARSPLLLQMQADKLGLPVVTAECPERACLGAALFAAVAAGLYRDATAAGAAMVRRAREFLPASKNFRSL